MAKELTKVEAEKALIAQMGMEAGTEEHLSREELQIPILKIAQKSTPQVDPDAPEFLDGLKVGDFFNSATGSIFKSPLTVQPLVYYRNFVIWEGEKGKGVYKGTLTPDEFHAMEKEMVAKGTPLVQDGGSFIDSGAGAEGADLRYTDTRNYAVILPEFSEEGILVYPMSSTGIKPSKAWNSANNIRMIGGNRAKRHATIWELEVSGFVKDTFTYKQVSKVKPIRWASADEFSMAEGFMDFARTLKDSEAVKYSEDSAGHEEPKEGDF